jgi:hypothetical protein
MDGSLVADGVLAAVALVGLGLLARRRILLAIGVVATGTALWATYLGPVEVTPVAIPLLVVGLGALGWAVARRSPDPPTIWNK